LLDSDDKPARYEQLLRELPAGLSEWAVHPGLDNAELLAIEGDSKHVRQLDYDFLMSQAAKDIIEEEGIILLDYRALQVVWRGK
jgi:chitin disaccharide deacetylase